MSEPFIGEVKLAGFGIVPKGWFPCDGRLLPIALYQALYSILGTTYGGDGVMNFALPDLRSRTAIGANAAFPLGQKAGEETHTLTISEMPGHTHQVVGSNNGPDAASPAGASWAAVTDNIYSTNAPGAAMNPAAVSVAGASQGHPNLQPYLTVNYIIAYTGIYPPRS